VAEHLTEEEQIESMKRWWDDNGKSTLVGIALAVTGYFGWGAYQDSQQVAAEAAASSYEALMQSLNSAPEGRALSAEQQATAQHLAKGLKAEHSSSLYAAQAALFMAQQAVKADDLERAAAELQWVLDSGVEQPLALLTRLRLARVQLAQLAFGAALATASDVDSGVFKSAFAEVRGDALLARAGAQSDASAGTVDVLAARAAYQVALDHLQQEDASRGALLQMKIDNLQPAPVIAATPVGAVDSPVVVTGTAVTEGEG